MTFGTIIGYAATSLESQVLRKPARTRTTLTEMTIERSKQAELYADEEAMLHQQLMIEQDILLQNEQGFRVHGRTSPIETEKKQRQSLAPETPMHAPATIGQQRTRPQLITRKLELMRQRISPKKVDNSEGIANLRAAIAA